MIAQTTEQKRQEIIKAVEAKRVSGAQLEPSRKGATVSAIKKGKPVAEETIDRLYSNLIELCPDLCQEAQTEQSQAQKQEQIAQNEQGACAIEQSQAQTTEQTAQAEQEIERLRLQVEKLEAENRQLRQKLQEVEQMEQTPVQTEQSTVQATVEAITIRLDAIEQRLATVEQNPAQRPGQIAQVPAQIPGEVMGFRLVKKPTKTAGKTYLKWYATKGAVVVYVGNDPGKAELKVRAYLAKKANPTDTASNAQENAV